MSQLQPVYDLIIATCEHHPDFHKRGALALRMINRLEYALTEIERFGHGDGHGRGYTCANIAAAALSGGK